MTLFGCERITRKKFSMGEPVQNNKPETVTMEGLDEIFITPGDPPWSEHKSTADQGWSLWQAADAYNVTERTVRRWIKENRITAWKVDGPRGPEWRINPGSSQDTDNVQAGSTDHSQSLIALMQILKDQAVKLEAATFRNGFLEAQTEVYENQVKLLPDLQAQVARTEYQEARTKALEAELQQLKGSWWYRVCCWFKTPTV